MREQVLEPHENIFMSFLVLRVNFESYRSVELGKFVEYPPPPNLRQFR